jgi:hypothetical protein
MAGRATTLVRAIETAPKQYGYSDRIPTWDVLSGRQLPHRTRRRRAFRLVSLDVEPPAGIEPATPSLPSMVGPLRAQGDPLLDFTTPQVTKTIGDRVVWYREAVCGAAAGKSLAHMQIIVGLSGPA